MSSIPQHVRRSGFSQAAFGALKDRVINKEDHGPKYAYSPGEPMHRVSYRDGVPHVYPGLVHGFESYINWHTSYTKPEVGTVFTAEQANDMTDKMRYGAPIYAGGILEDLTESPSGKEKCVVSIEAFENVGLDESGWEEFNAIIMPEPIFYEHDDVPPGLLPRWRALSPEITEKCRKVGGLMVRDEYLKVALRNFLEIGNERYARAVQQMLSANEAFRRFAAAYLEASDRNIDDRQNTGKNIYDTRDLRLEWLIAHKSKSTQQPQQIIVQSQAPAATQDIERKPCLSCGELISVTAKKCRYCGDAVPSAEAQIAALDVQLDNLQTEAKALTVSEPKPPRKNGIQRAADDSK